MPVEIPLIGRVVSTYKILEKLGRQLQDKKKAAAGKDREEWLRQSENPRCRLARGVYHAD